MAGSIRFGSLIDARLQKLEMTQEELATKIGVGPGTPSNWINGHRSFPIRRLQDLCKALALPPKSAERARFETEAFLSHSPEEVRHLVDDLEAQLAKMREYTLLIVEEARRAGIKLPETPNDL